MKHGHVPSNCSEAQLWDSLLGNTSQLSVALSVDVGTSFNGSSDWLLNGGAMHHLTNDETKMQVAIAYGGSHGITLSNGSLIPIKNIGLGKPKLNEFKLLLKIYASCLVQAFRNQQTLHW